MIDIHSHFLPFVDDGSDSIESSITVLKQACDQGVTDIILTPHYRGEYKEDGQSLLQKFNDFKQSVRDNNLNVNLYLGREIHITKDYKKEIEQCAFSTLNGSKYILIEFDFCDEQDIVNVVYELKMQGYIPIVAHLERYSYVDLSTAYQIKQTGGLIQINDESIIQPEWWEQKKLIKQLFKENMVDFVCSDMHVNRQYLMAKAYKKVVKRHGKETADAVFCDNALDIIKGQS